MAKRHDRCVSGLKHFTRTMGVHPKACGFGWVVCEVGIYTPIRGDQRLASVRQFERLLARFSPAEPALEVADTERRKALKQARQLGLDLVSIAADGGLSVEGYSRVAVQQPFGAVSAKTRDEIAEAVTRYYPGLARRLPRKRRAWDGEDRRLAIFNAAAVVLAHFHNGATALLEELSNVA